MSRGTVCASIMLAAAIALGTSARQARAQSVRHEPPMAADQPQDAAERALVTRHPDAWAKLTPEQREQLRQAYAHFRQLPPEQRQKVFQRYQQFQRLPPAERQHVLENYHRWRRMTPEQRKAARIRWRQFHLRRAPLTKIP